MTRILLLLVVVLASGCKTGLVNTALQPPVDLREFFRSEAEKLKAGGYSLFKTITYKGQTEEQYLTDPDWDAELHPAEAVKEDTLFWFQKFKIDTLKTAGGSVYTFRAGEQEYPVREIVLDLDQNGKIRSVKTYSFTSNPMYRIGRLSLYRPGKFLAVTGKIEVEGIESGEYAILSTFDL